MIWFKIYVRGVDDFGRERINDKEAKYTFIGFKPDVNDVVVILDPKENSGALYIVTKPGRSFDPRDDDSGPGIYEGIMQYHPPGKYKNGIDAWMNNNRDKHPKVVERLDEECNKLIRKHFTKLPTT